MADEFIDLLLEPTRHDVPEGGEGKPGAMSQKRGLASNVDEPLKRTKYEQNEVAAHPRTYTSWAKHLAGELSDFRKQRGEQKRAVVISSGCSGLATHHKGLEVSC